MTFAGGLVVESARPGDDAELRRLLRENPMQGAVRVSLEREPSVWLAAAISGSRHHAVVARDPASGRIAATGCRSVYDAWVGGEPCRLGYLSQLRIGAGGRGRRRLLAAGYAALGERRVPDELPFDVTTIVADNRPARRLLGAGLPGLPRYRELERFVTLVLPAWPRLPSRAPRGVVVERGDEAALPEVAAFLDRQARRHQFAPRVSAEALRCPSRSRGLAPGDFLLARRDGVLVGCVAVWDQSGYKQVVVRGYAPRLARFRPWLDLVSRLLGGRGSPRPARRCARPGCRPSAWPGTTRRSAMRSSAPPAGRPRGAAAPPSSSGWPSATPCGPAWRGASAPTATRRCCAPSAGRGTPRWRGWTAGSPTSTSRGSEDPGPPASSGA